jgi:putative heme-binding domain-containing protein
VLKRVVASHPPPQLQVAAIDALATFDDPAVAQTVISGWKSFSPEGRQRGIAALLGKRDRVPALLEAIELGEIETSALEVGARARLIEDTDNAVAARARKLFATSPDERNRVIERYRPALSLKGDIDRGKKLFDENCARCHTPRRQGDRIGPDLSGVNNKTKEELLTSILNSSYAIEPRYVNYIVTTKAGRVYDGVLANETPGSITLRGGAEEDITILRAQISDIRASRISLMPEDLEKSLDPQGVADVIAYLRGGI